MRCRIALLLLVLPATAHTQKAVAPDYFPVKLNSRWRYAVAVDNRLVRTSSHIARVVRQGDESEVLFEWKRGGKISQREVFRVTPREVLRTRTGPTGGSALVPPFPLLRYPLRAGQHWTWRGVYELPGASYGGRATVSVSGPDPIETPLGTLSALHIRADTELSTRPIPNGRPDTSGRTRGPISRIREDYWFAPDIGLVRQQLPTRTETLELRLLEYRSGGTKDPDSNK